MMYAIHNAHDVIVEALLQLGADMEHEEQQGYTPLMVACLSDNATACEMLLKNKAALDNTDSKGRTALSMACRCDPIVSQMWCMPYVHRQPIERSAMPCSGTLAISNDFSGNATRPRTRCSCI